ncbi:unnamed protein product [Arctia plantaginis]|uniref:FP protein C-terminal domain-containing protein n=1 Tax=Arctia plantaginis TaxID=874455 RepID=A0A8S1AEQ9_ARCPL|nr:unnamed protein product [Arctia plantaginis]
MPLKRTPPASAAPSPSPSTGAVKNLRGAALVFTPAPEGSPLQHCESEPDLHSFAVNIIERKKRKYDEENTDVTALIKEMFMSFSKEQDIRFQELKASMDVMSHKYDEFLSKISSLEKERKADKILIKELEEKLEIIERKSRITGIEIRNIPKQDKENKETLYSKIKKIGNILNLNIDDTNIKDIYRFRSKDASNPVVVDFTSVMLKDQVLKAVKSFNKNKAKGENLNANHLDPTYHSKPLYVAETLTQKTLKLYFLARHFKGSHGYNFCWTANGIVYLKKDENSSLFRIQYESDIDKLRNTL